MWKLHSTDLLQLKGGGGEPFAQFVDRLIRAEAAVGGLHQSEIRTQIRVNIPDGGVDTQVKQAIPKDKGWFTVPTCWQFKSGDAEENDLQKEINKPFVSDLIKQGYGYRICLLGDLPPPKVSAWETQLQIEASRINKDAPAPRLIHGGDLLVWADRFPAIIRSLRHLPDGVLDLEAWKANCRTVTNTYVPNPEWADVCKGLIDHVDFNAPPPKEACYCISGAAGVGKTRLVCESFLGLLQSLSLILVVNDEQKAKDIGTWLANSKQIAILIADECTPEARYFLNETLKGHRDYVRVITIDNIGEPVVVRSGREILTSADALKNAEAIFRENFPNVAEDRRRQYAQMSRGFIRFAADMCEHDAEIISAGFFSGVLARVEQYVRLRLGEHLEFVAALTLFGKVGFRDDVAEELETICQLTGHTKQKFHDAVRIVRESPGFVVQTPRYWYVTPEVVVGFLFAEGWERFVAHDPESFLKRLPPHLQEQLFQRVATLATEEVRNQVGKFFRTWFSNLNARDLANGPTTSLACAVVETLPRDYLPRLRSIIENALPGELGQIQGHLSRTDEPRRTLVWLLERLVSFPEYFDDCEAILFRLAVEESEPHIGNNATAIWAGLFSIYFSGTATHFHERLKILEKRLERPDIARADLWSAALGLVLQWPPGRLLVGDAMAAGRLRPNDWQPANRTELQGCLRAGLMVCGAHVTQGFASLHKIALRAIMQNLYNLLRRGFLDDLQQIIAPKSLTEEEVREFIHLVDDFLFVERNQPDHYGADLDKIRQWSNHFRSNDFTAKLREICSRSPWDERNRSGQTKERDEIAFLLIQDPALLTTQLVWLAGPEAHAAQELGFALGQRDENESCGRLIFEHAIIHKAMPLLRGYVQGMVLAERTPTAEFLSYMTRLESTHPDMALDILIHAGDSFDALNRILRLVDSHVLSPKYLAILAMGLGRRQLTCEEATRVFRYFVELPDEKDSALAGVRFLELFLNVGSRDPARLAWISSFATGSDVWLLAERVLPWLTGQIASGWARLLENLASNDPGRVAHLLGQGMVAEDFAVRQIAERELANLAKKAAASAMEGFGVAALDPKRGWLIQTSHGRGVIRQIPDDIVLNWVRNHGIEAARAVAFHLPPPYIDKSGKPVVPKLLDTILRDFDDDTVYGHFLGGSHSAESWNGNGFDRFHQEAENAREFLRHPNRRIREWAKDEIAYRQSMAAFEERRNEEWLLRS